jgi:hypothetical protein
VQILHAGGSGGRKEYVLLLMPWSRVVNCPSTLLIEVGDCFLLKKFNEGLDLCINEYHHFWGTYVWF